MKANVDGGTEYVQVLSAEWKARRVGNSFLVYLEVYGRRNLDVAAE